MLRRVPLETSVDCLQLPCIMPAREGSAPREPARKEKNPMKRAVRMLILMVGLVCTYMAAAAPMLPAPDGGPIPVCIHCR